MELSRSGGDALVKRLNDEEVLRATVEQLRKDLGAGDLIQEVPVNVHAFEALRLQVLPVLERKAGEGIHALQVVLYRVDLGETAAKEAMRLGGLHELAGRVVLRCLQKVVVRLTLR